MNWMNLLYDGVTSDIRGDDSDFDKDNSKAGF